jgi:homoserine O-acetyltransferase
VIVPDAIGHGKSSKPSDGMRARFPKYTYNDMVLAQHELLTKALGVDHLRLMIGTSMGCMHAWVWVERYPSFIDGAVPLACAPTEIAGRNRITRKLMIEYVTSDPAYNGGNYATPPMNGLRAATAIINLSGTSPKMMQRQAPTRAAADSVAMRTAHAERSNFDANDLCVCAGCVAQLRSIARPREDHGARARDQFGRRFHQSARARVDRAAHAAA